MFVTKYRRKVITSEILTHQSVGKLSMHQVNLKEAETRLADGAAFLIVPLGAGGASPKFGSAKGKVILSDDFDEPLADFEEYAP
ncbi:MAG: hypothetical protein NVS2B14_20810 [Chamaesiphon sp.]